MIKAIVLDFDGVVVESNGIKDQAFREMFQKFPEKFDEIMDYHLEHNAIIRYEKFKHIYCSILNQYYSDDMAAALAAEFSEKVVSKIIQCSFVPGAEDFLNIFSQSYPLYLVSMNPAQELDHILLARTLDHYFKKVYAYPWVKVSALRDIAEQESCRLDELVFVGDSFEDCSSAKEAGVLFVARDSGKSFRDQPTLIGADLFDVKRLLMQDLCA